MMIQRAASQPATPQPPEPWELELTASALRIRPFPAAERLWDRVLTEEDRLRLGGDFVTAYTKHGTAGMWAKLRGVSRERATVDVCHALGLLDDATHQWLLRELGQLPNDAEQVIQDAAQTGALVLVERPRAAYWQGQAIAVDWDRHGASWDYLWELGRHAKAGQSIDHTTFPASGDVAFVTKQKSRLLAQRGFPRTLAVRIKSAGRYAQKLDLGPEEVRLFEPVFGETVKERTA